MLGRQKQQLSEADEMGLQREAYAIWRVGKVYRPGQARAERRKNQRPAAQPRRREERRTGREEGKGKVS